MTKAPSSKKLNINYLVLKCGAPAGTVSLGVLGTVNFISGIELLFFVGNSPKKIEGLDEFEMKMVAAAPDAIRDDLKQLTSQNVPPAKLLEEVSHRYRGTIFASDRTTKEIPTSITSNTSAQQIFAVIAGAVMRLAKDEKVALATPTKRKMRRRSAKTAIRSRLVKTTHRRLGLPQQFELTALHV